MRKVVEQTEGRLRERIQRGAVAIDGGLKKDNQVERENEDGTQILKTERVCR